jgi:6-phosphofructokinase 1
MTKRAFTSIGVLTSGGDSPGMNPAVRAVVRAAIKRDLDVYAIYEGYRGMVQGGDFIRKMDWGSVGGILHQGGTIIGTARCPEFRTREGRRQAAKNLIDCDIDRLVVIGGDGSLTGANLFREEWPELVQELLEAKQITERQAKDHPNLVIIGMVGSIDNDMFGTDMTIGADTALHRIVEAIDAIASTAASHQRAFVIEVMGRHCGYLALMSALATGANWVLIPEYPPTIDNWEDRMCDALRTSRETGRRHSVVIVAEGACDRHGNPISSQYVKEVLEERLAEDTRVTILGHVQRGGAPSAFDRNLGTQTGYRAVDELLEADPLSEPRLIGIRENSLIDSPLMDCVRQTKEVAQVIKEQNFEKAMDLRGGSFKENMQIFRTLVRAKPRRKNGHDPMRILVMHSGGPAPGMNTALRAAVRLGMDRGHTMLAAHNGFPGLLNREIEEMEWMSVSGLVSRGGAELGTNRRVPTSKEYQKLAQIFEEYNVEGLMIIGGLSGYKTAHQIFMQSTEFRAFNIPIVCLPASINNNLPGSEHSIGSDTALNSIVADVDKIKQSAVASRRCFVVEVMGRYCGYLALMSGLATGAERVYLHEEGLSLDDLQTDLKNLVDGFKQNKRLGLMIRNENVDPFYTTSFISSLFEKEGGELFDVRQAILGHVQQGGNPSPFDRIQATRMAARCIDYLVNESSKTAPGGAFIGLQQGKVHFTSLGDLPRLIDQDLNRPKDQWWLRLREVARTMAHPD